MAAQAITIHVDAETAQAYEAVSAEVRRRLDVLLALRLREIARPARPIEEIVDEISRRARARGLTSELLDQLLDGS